MSRSLSYLFSTLSLGQVKYLGYCASVSCKLNSHVHQLMRRDCDGWTSVEIVPGLRGTVDYHVTDEDPEMAWPRWVSSRKRTGTTPLGSVQSRCRKRAVWPRKMEWTTGRVKTGRRRRRECCCDTDSRVDNDLRFALHKQPKSLEPAWKSSPDHDPVATCNN